MMQYLAFPKNLLVLGSLNVFLLASGAHADVLRPQLDIQTLNHDAGVSLSGSALTVDASAIAKIYAEGPVEIDPEEDFLLDAVFDSYLNEEGYHRYDFKDGSLSVGTLLTADFDSMTLILSKSDGRGSFSADLTYTGGNLMDDDTKEGSIEGTLWYADSMDYAVGFSASGLTAKVGPTAAPIPSALGLLSSGLIGLIGFRRRRERGT